MHIAEGVLSMPVLASGAVLTLAGAGIGLKRMQPEQIPKAAMLTAAFFVASLIHVPIGPGSAHLILNGLIGLLLGWGAFPAILVGLLLQALFFQFGGLTVLGVNTLNMALPAVLVHYLFIRLSLKPGFISLSAGFAAGCLAILGAGFLLALSLVLTGREFIPAAQTILAAHLPIMLIEGLLTSFILVFLKKVKPEMLDFASLMHKQTRA